MSVKSTSNRSLRWLIASWPSAASTTSNPAWRRPSAIGSRRGSLFSTRRTRMGSAASSCRWVSAASGSRLGSRFSALSNRSGRRTSTGRASSVGASRAVAWVTSKPASRKAATAISRTLSSSSTRTILIGAAPAKHRRGANRGFIRAFRPAASLGKVGLTAPRRIGDNALQGRALALPRPPADSASSRRFPCQDGQQAGQPRRPDEARKAAPGPEPRGHHKLVYKRTGIAAAIVHATIGPVGLPSALEARGQGWLARSLGPALVDAVR